MEIIVLQGETGVGEKQRTYQVSSALFFNGQMATGLHGLIININLHGLIININLFFTGSVLSWLNHIHIVDLNFPSQHYKSVKSLGAWIPKHNPCSIRQPAAAERKKKLQLCKMDSAKDSWWVGKAWDDRAQSHSPRSHAIQRQPWEPTVQSGVAKDKWWLTHYRCIQVTWGLWDHRLPTPLVIEGSYCCYNTFTGLKLPSVWFEKKFQFTWG